MVTYNEPAFPHTNGDYYFPGMTLRDHFAGEALPVVMQLWAGALPDTIAQECYRIADAMLTERSQPRT